MCGGLSDSQKQAQSSTADVAGTAASDFKGNTAVANPFFRNQVKNGLPFFNAESQYSKSDIGNQINRARTQQKAKFAGFGSALPSGFAESADRDLTAQGARLFDQNQLNLLQQQQLAKERAAGQLSGSGIQEGGLATQGNNSIMQAPQNNFWGNLVRGIISGGAQVGSAFA